MRQAKPKLEHVETDLLNNFKRLGVSAKVLNGRDRLHLMHDMFHMGDDDKFHFDWKCLCPPSVCQRFHRADFLCVQWQPDISDGKDVWRNVIPFHHSF